jgi:hypothetical protein
MKFKTYQKIDIAVAAKLEIPAETKDLVRAKQPQTFLGGKVRYEAPHPSNDETEKFSLLYPQDGTEVVLEEGDYMIETPKGLRGISKAVFESDYGLLEDEEEKPLDVVVTQEILDENPEMEEAGVKVGETIQVAPTEQADEILATAQKGKKSSK